MSLWPVILFGLPLLAVTLVLSLVPWRHPLMAFGLSGMVLGACMALTVNFDNAALWAALLGAPTAAALIGLARAYGRFGRSR